MRILNLYSGIGGNRILWGNDHEVTAVEHKQEIANIYHDFFPKDKIVVADAHQYLLDHYKEFDFIWSSPPCPSHSRVRFAVASGNNEELAKKQPPKYPDVALWQEIIFLKYYFKGKWCVENVVAYYEPILKPYEIAQHWFWTNFYLRGFVGGGS